MGPGGAHVPGTRRARPPRPHPPPHHHLELPRLRRSRRVAPHPRRPRLLAGVPRPRRPRAGRRRRAPVRAGRAGPTSVRTCATARRTRCPSTRRCTTSGPARRCGRWTAMAPRPSTSAVWQLRLLGALLAAPLPLLAADIARRFTASDAVVVASAAAVLAVPQLTHIVVGGVERRRDGGARLAHAGRGRPPRHRRPALGHGRCHRPGRRARSAHEGLRHPARAGGGAGLPAAVPRVADRSQGGVRSRRRAGPVGRGRSDRTGRRGLVVGAQPGSPRHPPAGGPPPRPGPRRRAGRRTLRRRLVRAHGHQLLGQLRVVRDPPAPRRQHRPDGARRR